MKANRGRKGGRSAKGSRELSQGREGGKPSCQGMQRRRSTSKVQRRTGNKPREAKRGRGNGFSNGCWGYCHPGSKICVRKSALENRFGWMWVCNVVEKLIIIKGKLSHRNRDPYKDKIRPMLYAHCERSEWATESGSVKEVGRSKYSGSIGGHAEKM